MKISSAVFGLMLFFGCIMSPLNVAANPCASTSEAAQKAIEKRNKQVEEILSTVPNPSDTRAEAAKCLDVIANIGGAFDMGVKIPSMDQILNQACQMATAHINKIINETLNKGKEQINEYTQYVVNGNPMDLANDALSELMKK